MLKKMEGGGHPDPPPARDRVNQLKDNQTSPYILIMINIIILLNKYIIGLFLSVFLCIDALCI